LTDSSLVRVWLSLGSNQSPYEYLPKAIEDLSAIFGELTLSPVYESEAVGFKGDNFLNMVVGIETALSPRDLNLSLKEIEIRHGRERSESKFDARTLDIDLLTYGAEIVNTKNIRLPRDEILHYAFVLRPLSDVAGDELHPLAGRTYRELWQEFNHSEQSLWPVEMELEPNG
jgi:2-amino-4-hydroxy-6-hydroxymethyldihydropteridine diphosphokinase